jgi:phosphate transport system ATP-binding protein
MATVSIRAVRKAFGSTEVLHGVDVEVADGEFVILVGPSGCGKSTLLRMIAGLENISRGEIAIGGTVVNNVAPKERDIAMVFQQPTPFPMSIYDNVAFGVRLYEKISKADLDQRVEESLKRSALWNEVKDKLHTSGLGLSGGQQQRLCVARTIAVRPEVILLDEPASALDPISTAKLEETLVELKADYTIVIVTHNLQQAARISDHAAFMFLGRLIEFATTAKLFDNPKATRTADYITGRFG